VDYVPDVLAGASNAAEATPIVHPGGDPVGLDIGAHRLPDARIDEALIVSGTDFVAVRVSLALTLASGAQEADVRAAVKAVVRNAMHPLHGGPAGQAGEWPAADLEAKVRAVAGVTQARCELATDPAKALLRDSAGLQVLKLNDDQLVDVTTEIAVS
jgi:hypothetical protein